MRSTLVFAVVLGSLAAACGGAADTTLLGDGGGGGGGDGSTVDSVAPDGGTSCDLAKCGNIPSGFHPINLVDGSTACASGLDSTDVVTAPVASDGACTCACNVTTQPDCTNGSITRSLQTTMSSTCSQQATTFQGNGGACSPINNNLYLSYSHYAVNAPPPSGGACQYDAQVDPQKITSTKARVCAPPASCPGAVCTGGAVCVAQTGDVACPADFPKKTLVGTSATADCSACGASCSVTGQCTGTLSFYTDPGCSQNGVDFTADGQCTASTAPTTTAYTYYQWNGSVQSASCGGTAPTSTATAKLDVPTTVCCKN